MSNKEAKHTTFQEKRLPRNRTLHRQHIDRVREDPTTVRQTGVKEKTILDDLHYFSAVEATVPDIMHDILEGIGKRELKLILSAFIESKTISLSYLNNRIESFNFG